METIKINYEGDLRTNAVHLKSGNALITDAPTDNQGKGEAFSPTDLLATALGSCMMTIMGIHAKKNNIKLDKVSAKVTKIMAANPRRVSELIIEFTIAGNQITEDQKKGLEDSAINCPVAKSIHPDLIQRVIFNY